MRKYFNLVLCFGLILFSGLAKAQSVISPDTVCAGSDKFYDVTPSVGSTYYWSLKGGSTFGTINTIAGRTDSISITYSAATGIDTLQLVEAGPSGCISDTVKLAIVKLPAISVSISGTDSICQNSLSAGILQLNFTGVSPYSVTFTDGTTPVSITTISNPYFITSPVYSSSGVYPFTITSATGSGSCPANISGSASITVFPKPSPGAINHY